MVEFYQQQIIPPVTSGETKAYSAITVVRVYRLQHSLPQRPRSFWSAPRIATSGQVQHRKSRIQGLPVTQRMLRVKSDKPDWFWSQSIVFTNPFKTESPGFTDFLSLTTCSESSLTNLIGSGLNLLCLQIHSKPEVQDSRTSCHSPHPQSQV